MSFASQTAAAFTAALGVFRSGNLNACVMRWPVNRAGADLTGARNYDAIEAPSPDNLALVAGGLMADYQFSMTCLKADFNTMPTSGSLLLRNGRVSRILTIENAVSPTVDVSPILYLHCGTPDK